MNTFYKKAGNRIREIREINRYTRSEVIYRSAVNVPEIQKKIDEISKKYREMDTKLQELNWNTELL